MTIRDKLHDLVSHTKGLNVGILKLTGENGKVKIEGMDDNKSVVIKGQFKNDIPEFEGIFGLGNLDFLSGYVNIYNEPKTDDVEVIRKKKKVLENELDDDGDPVLDGNNEPVTVEVEREEIFEFKFKRKLPKMNNTYRVIDRRMIPDQFDFVGGNAWDVEVVPTARGIGLLQQQANVGFDEFFGVKTEQDSDGVNKLFLVLGKEDSAAQFEFASDVVGTLTKPWCWPIDQTLKILKYSENAECKMSFLDKGAMMITVDSGIAEYSYILPAKSR